MTAQRVGSSHVEMQKCCVYTYSQSSPVIPLAARAARYAFKHTSCSHGRMAVDDACTQCYIIRSHLLAVIDSCDSFVYYQPGKSWTSLMSVTSAVGHAMHPLG